MRNIHSTVRRFARQALRSVLLGRVYGDDRKRGRSVATGTTSASPLVLALAATHHDITTGGVARQVQVGATGTIGQRKLIRLATLTTGGDTFTLDAANLGVPKGRAVVAVTSLTFNAAGQYALLEWNGSKWLVLKTTATLV